MDFEIIICRLCFLKTQQFNSIEIFSENGKFLNVSNIISKHFWFEVQQTDTLQYICKKCWKNVLSFHNYYKSIEVAQHKIYKNCATIKIPSTDKLIRKDVIEIENSVVELVNNETIGDVVGETVQTFLDESTEKSAITQNIDEINQTTEYLEDKKIIEHEANTNNVRNVYEVNTKISIEDEMIQNYFDMNCDLCDAKFTLFGDAKQHYKRIHKKSGYITCCTKKFFRRGKVVEHILLHRDPLLFQCKICNKINSDRAALREHIKIHIPMSEKSHKCDICTKAFAKSYQLKTHKIIRHSLDADKQFRCEICSRTFVHKSLLTDHIKQIHELAYSRICDICAKVFKNATSYDYHRFVEHSEGGLKKYQCEICGTWLKHERVYLIHMKRHKETGETCQYCGKSSTNKKAMTAHINRVHLNVKTYSCTICNKVLKSAQSLKEHMSQHTGDTLYSCTCCEKRFNSSANMYAHRKRAHPKEHAENKGLRTKLLTENEKMK